MDDDFVERRFWPVWIRSDVGDGRLKLHVLTNKVIKTNRAIKYENS